MLPQRISSAFSCISFAFETFLPNPGDYSFLYTGDVSNLTTKWWVTSENVTENGMYGQKGILYNETIWRAFKGTILVSVACALLVGSIGTMIGYAVSKNRRSRWANYVNSVAFLPYLMPSIAVGVAFFILFSTEKLNLFNTCTLLIIVGGFLLTGVIFGSSLFNIGSEVPLPVTGDQIMLFDRKSGRCITSGSLTF